MSRVTDIYLALALLTVASIAALAVSLRIGRRSSRRAATLACVVVVGLIVAHVVLISDRLWVTRLLPFENVVILGNLLPVAVGLLAGFAWRIIPGNLLRRSILLVLLGGICVYRSVLPVFATQPAPLSDHWMNDVCLQTSPATCSPAAAATLLRAHGIDASEEEMARLCLTGLRGTSNHGLYRGLKIKTAGTEWDVEAFTTDAAGLRQMEGPAILSVRLDSRPEIDPRYEKLWGWQPDVPHAVVFFRFVGSNSESVEMGDPSVGREYWSARDIAVLWHGEGMRLVKRRH